MREVPDYLVPLLRECLEVFECVFTNLEFQDKIAIDIRGNLGLCLTKGCENDAMPGTDWCDACYEPLEIEESTDEPVV